MQFHVCVTFKQGDRISFFMWDCEAFFYPVFPCLTSWDIVPNINWLCRTYPFSIVCACAVKAINVSLSNTKLPMEIYKSPKKKNKKIKKSKIEITSFAEFWWIWWKLPSKNEEEVSAAYTAVIAGVSVLHRRKHGLMWCSICVIS